MPELQPLAALRDASRAALPEWPSRYPDRRAIGFMCRYVPVEIMHAAGLEPVRLRSSSEPLRRVDGHLQSFTCALCRSTFDQALGGRLGFLAGVVFAHSCDTMQALADLWQMNSPAMQFVDTVMQPSHLGSSAARAYLIAELHRFRERLASFFGTEIGDDRIWASIRVYDEMRCLVQSLEARRDRLDTPSFYAVLDAAQVMPANLFNDHLAELLSELESAPTRRNGPRLLLCGAVLDEPRLLEILEGLGAHVAGDDLCSGSRHFEGMISPGQDPIAALADLHLSRPPCPCKLQPSHSPAATLMRRFREMRADGLVFVLEKFCEPHAFDYAQVLPELDRSGIPHLLLEMEHTPSLEALRTRLQAFVEIL